MTCPVVRDQLELGLFADLFDEPLDTPPPAPAAPKTATRAHVRIVTAEIEDRTAKATDFPDSFTTSLRVRMPPVSSSRPIPTTPVTTPAPDLGRRRHTSYAHGRSSEAVRDCTEGARPRSGRPGEIASRHQDLRG
ncbi:hypothetical protein GCM10018782_10640 [Streptomyces griseoaurantiacus]|nr:hypothetical protein GCM10018782_10640 [Streptomyces griseoaurantiacus]